MGRKPGSEADVRDPRGMRVHAERYCRSQHHGAFVNRCFPRSHLYARVRLSICGYRHLPGQLNQTDGGSLAVSQVCDGGPVRQRRGTGAVDTGCHLPGIQIHDQYDKREHSNGDRHSHGRGSRWVTTAGEKARQA